MSKTELKVWAWLLGVSGVSALLIFILPVTAVIFLCYLFIGMVMAFCPFIFLYGLCTFGLNAALSRVMPKPFWLRIGLSLVVVVAGAHLLSAQLNSARTAAYNQVVAQDMALAAKPVFSRLVLVDDRRAYNRPEDPVCRTDCIAYLANGAAHGVMMPVSVTDRPFITRDYRLFTYRPGCVQARDFSDAVDRVWKGDCVLHEDGARVAVGDLVVHAFTVTVPYQTPKCLCERFEVYLMTPAGLKLIERQTSFQMMAYGDMPVPMRDAGWNGSNYDHGISWIGGGRPHWRFYEHILKDDLGLSPDVYTQAQKDNEDRQAREDAERCGTAPDAQKMTAKEKAAIIIVRALLKPRSERPCPATSARLAR